MKDIQKLIEVVKALRAPEGCPWDKEQTFKSLTPHILEEAYELVDAIDNKNIPHIKEELGDALLHVVMLSEMASEDKHFTLNDVAKEVTNKMIERHPHVFSDTKVKNVDEVWTNWEKIKKEKSQNNSAMDNIPNALPALLKAHKIQNRASRLGFDWNTVEGPLEKIQEELNEIQELDPKKESDKDHLTEEAGDLLFACVNYIRKLNIDPEIALKTSNKKFITRFKELEKISLKKKKPLDQCNIEELETLWEIVKKQQNKIHSQPHNTSKK